MELIKIEIESYKSIKSPITLSFLKDLPTILIGKNGSGKTNVLEALSAIALANTNDYGSREKEQLNYHAYIQLNEEDVGTMLPDVVYDKASREWIIFYRAFVVSVCGHFLVHFAHLRLSYCNSCRQVCQGGSVVNIWDVMDKEKREDH